ncbi:MAG: hypothetical protein JW995_00535 [Melioribacteraceae bacterium]|nr:hypothetical protein [Melioribacteraceae bacterium]
MDFIKQYIIQSVIVAANNLRLNSEKIEVVAILREHLSRSQSIGEEIIKFKKKTELSKLGIKLGEIHKKISTEKIDFLKISDDFKEQSSSLVVVLSNFLDVVTPSKLREIIESLSDQNQMSTEELEQPRSEDIKIIEIPQDDKSADNDKQEQNELKKEIIFEGLEKEQESDDELNIEDFQKRILKPVKNLESVLVQMLNMSYDEIELKSYIDVLKNNAELAESVGFKLLSNMHLIMAVGMKLIVEKKLIPDVNIIENLRACLIVIVAIVRRKEVDITGYLNRAEKFGEQILKYK